MRYLVFSDVHANLEALGAVLDDAPPYDAALCLGDLVGYGPDPNECVDRIRDLPGLTSLVGNHDWAALGRLDTEQFNDDARRAAEWTAAHLRPDVSDFLSGLDPVRQEDGFMLAHGSPREPIWEYLVEAEQAPPNFLAFEGAVCFVGHTHVPRIFANQVESGRFDVFSPQPGDVLDLADGVRRILNPGGVGQPRDGDPRAAYGLWDTESGAFTFRRVTYPVATTQKKIREAGLPSVLASRLRFGL